MPAYSESLVGDAKKHLGDAFDYALNDCAMTPDAFTELFEQSGIAALFGEGNPAVVSGMSGTELARAIMSYAYGDTDYPDRRFAEAPTPAFWAGWALAQYQHASGRRFDDIFRAVPLSDVLLMHRIYHEMDISHFNDEMERRITESRPQTHLQATRLARGLSQTQLAELAGVNARNIQLYEQRVNDINRAQAITLHRLAHVLGCSMESLLENPTV